MIKFNNKIRVRKYIINVSVNPAYIVENNKLVAITKFEETARFIIANGGIDSVEVYYSITTATGTDIVKRVEEMAIYSSEENFKKGVVVDPEIKDSFELIMYGRFLSIGGLNFSDIKSYYYNGKIAEEVTPKNEILVINASDVYVDGIKLDYTNTYRSVEECYRYNPYTIVHPDGTEEVKHPAASRLNLSEEQRAIVAKFRDLMKEMKENNIEAVYNSDFSELVFFDKQHVVEYGYNCGADGEDQDEVTCEALSKSKYTEQVSVSYFGSEDAVVVYTK